MSYTILIIRSGTESPEYKTYHSRAEYLRAKAQWKRLANRNRKERSHHVYGDVIATIPQCERGF